MVYTYEFLQSSLRSVHHGQRCRSPFPGLLLAASLLACGARVDPMALPAGAFSVPPGVRLGMSARELEELRPNVQLPEYGNRWERVDSTVIGYHFAGIRFGADQNLKPGLAGIFISLELGSSAEARTRWQQLTDVIEGIHGPPAWCEEIRGPSPGIQAHWKLSRTALQVAVREPLHTGSEVVPDRVGLTVARDAAPPHPDGVKIPCP